MSFTLHGIAVSSGIAIGHAHLISHTLFEVAHYLLPKKFLDEEIALASMLHCWQLAMNSPACAVIHPPMPLPIDAFIELHQMILDDPRRVSRRAR